MELDTAFTATTRSPGRAHALKRVVHNALIDLRFGRFLGGTYLWNRDASCSDYALLELMFEDRLRTNDVLVDVGSGGGRVINQWLRMGHKGPIYGLEADPALASRSARRLQSYPNVSIVAGDATAQLPSAGTVFYLFNPFDSATMTRFADHVATVAANPHLVTIMYFNCKHLDVFTADPRFNIESVELVRHPSGDGQQLATIGLAAANIDRPGPTNR